MRDTIIRPQTGLVVVAIQVSALGVAAAIAFEAIRFYASNHWLGADAGAYWHAWHTGKLYGLPPGALDAYLYSPAFAEVTRPLALLPRNAFCITWIAVEATVFMWLLRPLGRWWGSAGFLMCVPELCLGNVYGLYALVLVVGFRAPGAWSLPVLTKITTGQGLLWFTVRREWRRLFIALATVGTVVAVSFAADHRLWLDWFHFLDQHRPDNLMRIRVLAACAVTAVGARTDRRWLLPVAVMLSCPTFNLLKGVSILSAIPRLLMQGGDSEPLAGSTLELAGTENHTGSAYKRGD